MQFNPKFTTGELVSYISFTFILTVSPIAFSYLPFSDYFKWHDPMYIVLAVAFLFFSVFIYCILYATSPISEIIIRNHKTETKILNIIGMATEHKSIIIPRDSSPAHIFNNSLTDSNVYVSFEGIPGIGYWMSYSEYLLLDKQAKVTYTDITTLKGKHDYKITHVEKAD